MSWHNMISKKNALLFLVFFLTMIYLEKAQHNNRLQIKVNNLLLSPNQKADAESYIKSLVF